jgi:hypothetical protein
MAISKACVINRRHRHGDREFLKHAFPHRTSKNTDAQEIRMAQPALQYGEKRKNPALPGFFDEYVFRSAYFASLAI